MSNVWKRLQRVGKKAAKFHFTTQLHELVIKCNAKWQPNKVSFAFAHKNRKVISKLVEWEPGKSNVYEGTCKWNENDIIEFNATLYKGINDNKFEPKEWSIIIECDDKTGKKRLLASAKLNLEAYAKFETYESDVNLKLKLLSTKIEYGEFKFKLFCKLLREGKATDEDMISIHSYDSTMSTYTHKINKFMGSTAALTNDDSLSEFDNDEFLDLDEKLEEKSIHDDDHDPNNNIKFNNNNKPLELNENNSNKIEILSATSSNLLEWCKNIIVKQSLFKLDINDFSASWKNGLAFCLIIHHYRPNLINLNKLNENDACTNLKIAFNASDSESIPRVIEISDMLQKKRPDKLSIMTYLHQVRAHYEKEQNNKLKSTSTFLTSPLNLVTSSTPIINNKIKSKSSSPLLLNDKSLIQYNAKNKQSLNPFDSDVQETSLNTSPNRTKKSTNPFETDEEEDSKLKELEKTNDKNTKYPSTNPFDSDEQDSSYINDRNKQKKLYESHNQYINPFDSDDQDDSKIENKPSIIKIKENGKISDATNDDDDDDEPINVNLSPSYNRRNRSLNSPNLSFNRNSSNNSNENTDYKQQARKLIQQTRFNNNIESSGIQQQQHKQENVILARKLISEAKKTTQPKIINFNSIEGRKNKLNKFKVSIAIEQNSLNSSYEAFNATKSNTTIDSIKQSYDQNSDVNESLIGDEYISKEVLLVENEQLELDKKATVLEKELRNIMNSNRNDENKLKEEDYMREWFLLINQKSALIHRQLELEILKKEKNLQKRYELLNKELRKLMQIDDKLKTEEIKRNEKLLLNELVLLVDKRNELVEQLDEENRNLESEYEINNFIQNYDNFQDKSEKINCTIQ